MVRFRRRYKNSDRTGTVRVPVSPHNLKKQTEHFAQLLDLGYPIECRLSVPDAAMQRVIVYTQQGVYENSEFIPAQSPIQILDVDEDEPLPVEDFDETTLGIEDLIEFDSSADELGDEPAEAAIEPIDVANAELSTLLEAPTVVPVEHDNQPPMAELLSQPDMLNLIEQPQQPAVDDRQSEPIEPAVPMEPVEQADTQLEEPIELPDKQVPAPVTPLPDSIAQFSEQLFEQWRQMASCGGNQDAIPWKTPVSVEALYEQGFRHMSAFIFLSYLDVMVAQGTNPQQRLVLIRSTANQSYIEFLTFSTSAVAVTPLKPVVAAAPVIVAEEQPAAFTEPSTPIPPVGLEYLDRLRAFAEHNRDYAEEMVEGLELSYSQPEPLAAPFAPFWRLFKRHR